MTNNTQNNTSLDTDLYTKMLNIHKHIFDQLKYAETKCGIVTTISLGFFAVLARMIYILLQGKSFNFYTCLNFVDFISFALLAICTFLCILCLWDLLKAFDPQLINRENACGEPKGNIYFFLKI